MSPLCKGISRISYKLAFIIFSCIQRFFFIAEHLLRERLTEVPQLHSHLEILKNIEALDEQISLSYSEDNVIELPGPFSTQVDPTR